MQRVPADNLCDVCEKLFFSYSLRGYPIKELDWFKNEVMDSYSSYYLTKRSGEGDIVQKFTKHCLPREKFLRDVSRKNLLDALIARFRGFYERGDDDCNNFINNNLNFDELDDYFKWKDDWDDNYHEEWTRTHMTNLYCSGCGELCETKTRDNFPYTNYQVYRLNQCHFFL